MNVILFGATGMVGQGVLRECLLDPEVRAALSIEPPLSGFDACFFCLGVASAGMTEPDYRRESVARRSRSSRRATSTP